VFIYARALRYFRPYFWPTLTGLVLTFVAIIVNSLKPWPFKYIVDGVLPSDVTQGSEQARAFIKHWFGSAPPEQIAFWLCLILVVVSVLGALITLVGNYLFIRVGLNALVRLRTDLYACLQSLPLKYHDARRSSCRTSAAVTALGQRTRHRSLRFRGIARHDARRGCCRTRAAGRRTGQRPRAARLRRRARCAAR